ncbi:MAG: lysophospholipid acyltransferase family protein [Luteolibacter sp.]
MNRLLRKTRRLAALAKAIHLARRESISTATLPDRGIWQQRQARRMLAALEVRLSVSGTLPPAGLVVCNHLSYLDVLVLAAQAPAVFVAKSDVRAWPVIGNLLESAGTILAQRGRPMSTGTTAAQIREVFSAGLPVILFPEGTSTDGSSMLPFKPTLLQTALDAGVPVTAAAISYHTEDGNSANDICYRGDAVFLPHIIRLAGLESINASLSIGTASILPENRKLAASQLHAEAMALLARIRSPDIPVRR